jgi:hypothetical protein
MVPALLQNQCLPGEWLCTKEICLPTNSSWAKSRVALWQSECTLMPRKPREQSKSPWRWMVRLYLSYIKAEDAYRRQDRLLASCSTTVTPNDHALDCTP